jgi:phospho-N-acetylmuramoyl-pentapeptide-transferase
MTISRSSTNSNLGLTARAKLMLQGISSFVIAVVLIGFQFKGGYSTHLIVPFFKRFHPDLVISSLQQQPVSLAAGVCAPFVIFIVLVITFSSNAVNLTDGLDGLAIGCTVVAAGALTVLTYVSGHVIFASLPGAYVSAPCG